MILFLQNNIRGGITSVMCDRYVKSDDNKKIIFIDATNLYCHSMSQPLSFYKIEMWHGHPDLYMNKLADILNTADDSLVDFPLKLIYPIQKIYKR